MNAITYSSDWGTCTLKRGTWRLQLYWPYLRIRISPTRNHKELIVSGDTVLRLVIEDGYFGAGIQVMGLGVAMDWMREEAAAR